MREANRIGLALAVILSATPSVTAERAQPQAPRTETMQPCPKQGPGFVRVPGSATCIRVGGRAIGGIDIDSRGSAPVAAGQLSIDTRTDSDLGPIRAFVRMGHGRP